MTTKIVPIEPEYDFDSDGRIVPGKSGGLTFVGTPAPVRNVSVAPTISKIETAEPAVTIPKTSESAPYFTNVANVVMLPEISSPLFDAAAVLATIDRVALDAANVEFADSEVWLSEAETNHQAAVSAYKESLAKPFATLTDYGKNMDKLAEKVTRTKAVVTFAQDRVNALRAKLNPLIEAYNAEVKVKMKEAIEPMINDLYAKEAQLQAWFTETVIDNFRRSRGYSPRPSADDLIKYGTKFSELALVETQLSTVAQTYLGRVVNNQGFKVLNADGIITLARRLGVLQAGADFDLDAVVPSYVDDGSQWQEVDAKHPLRRNNP